jgi:hypothetical protein
MALTNKTESTTKGIKVSKTSVQASSKETVRGKHHLSTRKN